MSTLLCLCVCVCHRVCVFKKALHNSTVCAAKYAKQMQKRVNSARTLDKPTPKHRANMCISVGDAKLRALQMKNNNNKQKVCACAFASKEAEALHNGMRATGVWSNVGCNKGYAWKCCKHNMCAESSKHVYMWVCVSVCIRVGNILKSITKAVEKHTDKYITVAMIMHKLHWHYKEWIKMENRITVIRWFVKKRTKNFNLYGGKVSKLVRECEMFEKKVYT